MEWINAAIEIENRRANAPITLEEWCEVRRNGTPDEIAEAVERMEEAGGYENLE